MFCFFFFFFNDTATTEIYTLSLHDALPISLDLDIADGRVTSREYPDALGRLWSALECPHAGDVLMSASPRYEFVDWGGADHVGGGSHGSLDRDDSEGVLLFCGIDAEEREEWSVVDVTRLVLDHF